MGQAEFRSGNNLVVRDSMRFFADPKGPKPGVDTVFSVSLVGDHRTWKVRARSVLNGDTLGK